MKNKTQNKTQDELTLEQFVSLLDTALLSDNPAIQNALRSLLTITILVTAQNPGDELIDGPLRSLVETVKNLEERLGRVESEQLAKRSYPGTGHWIVSPNTTGTGPGPGVSYTIGDDPNYKGAQCAQFGLLPHANTFTRIKNEG